MIFPKLRHAFNHGIDLAELVLRETPDWKRGRINAVLETGKRTFVNLKNPLPVHLTYSTAWRGEGGTINFRPDIYGRDKSLHEALFSQKAARRTSTTAATQP